MGIDEKGNKIEDRTYSITLGDYLRVMLAAVIMKSTDAELALLAPSQDTIARLLAHVPEMIEQKHSYP